MKLSDTFLCQQPNHTENASEITIADFFLLSHFSEFSCF